MEFESNGKKYRIIDEEITLNSVEAYLNYFYDDDDHTLKLHIDDIQSMMTYSNQKFIWYIIEKFDIYYVEHLHFACMLILADFNDTPFVIYLDNGYCIYIHQNRIMLVHEKMIDFSFIDEDAMLLLYRLGQFNNMVVVG